MPVSGLRLSSVNNINNMKKPVSIGANGLFVALCVYDKNKLQLSVLPTLGGDQCKRGVHRCSASP